jgi:hypothetical protein
MTPLDMWTENENEDEEDDESEKKEAAKNAKPSSPHETFEGHKIHSRRKKEAVVPVPVVVKKKKMKDPTGLVIAQRMLQERIGGPFQRHLSKFIRVSDIPRGVESVDPVTVQAELVRRLKLEEEETKCMESEDINRYFKRVNSRPDTAEMTDCLEGLSGDTIEVESLEPRKVVHLSDSDAPAVLGERGLGFGTTTAMLDHVLLSASPEEAMQNLMYILPHVPKVEVLIPNDLPQLVAESQYDAKRRQLEELRLLTKAKMLEELDNAPKTKEPLGAAMHSDDDILLIFGDDSLFHDDPTFPYDEINKVKKGPAYDLKMSQAAELMFLLKEIEAEEDKHGGPD